MQKIMIIEDDEVIREELSLLLRNEGYVPFAVYDFGGVADQVCQLEPDLILLDLGLPGRDGFLLCGDIRKKADIPIIFVTSRDGAMDELRALSLGGDDYITKPYNMPVLLARIKAVLRRRGKESASDVMEIEGVRLILSKGVVQYKGASAELSRNELRILAHLMGSRGNIVSRPDLLDAMWDSHICIDDNTLSVNMTRLRAKLSELGLPDFIKTRRGMGYQI